MNFLKNKIWLTIEELPWIEPVELFKRVELPFYFFLDSAATSIINKNSRWSYLSVAQPKIIFKSLKDTAEINYQNKSFKITSENPMEIVSHILKNTTIYPRYYEIPFMGGAVGYISYEYARHFEKVLTRKKERVTLPECYFIFVENYIAFDLHKKKAYLVVLSDKSLTNIKSHKKKILDLYTTRYRPKDFQCNNCFSNFNIESFSKAVRKVKRYISAGDIFQANIAQRWCGSFIGDSKSVYLNLRKINPSPYACYLKFPEVEIISCSPELLLRRRKNIVETRPIAGTRRRGRDDSEDRLLKEELLLDKKEKAEHIMLVDLERNDLGKISKFNSVRVIENMTIEQYSHVSHIVSNIRGVLKKNTSQTGIIRAVFPGGTITGCPKIRAIEIIDEIEPVERGPYCGSAGWLSYNGDMDINILIRTIIKTHNTVYFYAGAGVVADSIPEREYKETLHKAKALSEALRVSI